MAWQGTTRISTRLGAPVKVGSLAVPKTATLVGTGDGHEPDFRLEFQMSPQGEATCTEIHVIAKKPGRGLRNGDLGVFNVSALASATFDALAFEVIRDAPDLAAVLRATKSTSHSRPDINRAISKGAGVTWAELVDVAWVYAQSSKAPLKEVETRLAVSRRTAARRVEMARKEGLLPPKGRDVDSETIHNLAEIRELIARQSKGGALPIPELKARLDAWHARAESQEQIVSSDG